MAKKKAGPRLPAFSRGASSANPDRVPGRKANRSGGSLRDKATIKRLKLYTGGKVKRDKQGVVVEGDLARRDPFSVVLHRKRVPTALVEEPSDARPAKLKREELLAAEPFERSGTARKRVRGAADSLEALAAKARRAS